MVKLRSRQNCPVNGFQFVDAAISPDPMQTWDFEQLVRQIADRRAANPRFKLTTDLSSIRQELDLQNALRMQTIQGADSYITTDTAPMPNPRMAPHSPRWSAVAGGVKRATAGAATLTEWLGDGANPVPPEQASARAKTCVDREGKPCPKHGAGDWLGRFTEPVADKLRAMVAIQKSMNLTTPYDDRLNFCDACSCPLKLKVHVPMAHIAAHMTEEVRAGLDPHCWILKENP